MKKQSKWRQIFAPKEIQLCISLLFFALVLISCNSTTDKKNVKTSGNSSDSVCVSDTQNTALDSTIHYLLDASAKDFIANQPPLPVSFRNIKVRNLVGQNSENHYMICGQFLARDKQNKEEWSSFATIKTSDYEQWIGTQSVGYCKESKAISYKISDLSSSLKRRVDSLQKMHPLKK
ncbi:MAG: hypothetical protein WCR42_00890 [bacterium]